MQTTVVVILCLFYTLSAHAQQDINRYLSNRTFSGYHNIEHYQFKRYFSDYGMVFSTFPGRKTVTGEWELEENSLCIKWKYKKRNCYSVKISGDIIKVYKPLENGNIQVIFSLTNPKQGNRLNKLSPAGIAALDSEVLKEQETLQKTDNIETGQETTGTEVQLETRTSKYSLSVGAATRFIGVHIGTENQGNETVDDLTLSPSLTLRTPYTYFSSQSRFGWYVEAGYSHYDLVDSCFLCNRDAWSTAKGHYAYIAPTIFFSMSNPWRKTERSGAWKLGLGLGLAYLEGEASLSRGTSSTADDENIDYSATGYIVNLFIDYRLAYLTLRFRRSQAWYEDDDNNNDYRINDLGVETYLTFDF